MIHFSSMTIYYLQKQYSDQYLTRLIEAFLRSCRYLSHNKRIDSIKVDIELICYLKVLYFDTAYLSHSFLS